MPKSTFLKLKEEKREKITEAALKEFSENSFNVASINQIVKDSDIAKGSFYQYFEDKEDLYNYILEICLGKKEEYLSEVLKENEYNEFYDVLKSLFLRTITFKKNNNREFNIIDKCGRELNLQLKKDLEMRKDYFNYLPMEELFEMEKEEGNIVYDIDTKPFIRILSRINCLVIEEYNKNSSSIEIEKYIEDIIELLKNGIKPRKSFSRTKNIEDRFY